MGKCRWCSATSKRRKVKKKCMKRSCHLLDTVPVKQFYHSAVHDMFPHKSTAVKIIFIFHPLLPPPTTNRPKFNFIISKMTWLISVVVSIILRKRFFFLTTYRHRETFKIMSTRNVCMAFASIISNTRKIKSRWITAHLYRRIRVNVNVKSHETQYKI